MNQKQIPQKAPLNNKDPQYGGKFDDELYYKSGDYAKLDTPIDDVAVSNQFGREEFAPIQVPRPKSDYGWEGDADVEAERSLHNGVRADVSIQAEVAELLRLSAEIDSNDIEITVRDGQVTLLGTIPEKEMKYLAEENIKHVAGLKNIQNFLTPENEANETDQL